MCKIFNNITINRLRYAMAVAWLLTAFMYADAQSYNYAPGNIIDALTSKPGITIEQPQALTKRLEYKQTDESQGADQAQNGRTATRTTLYHVEAYADNSRQGKHNATQRMNNLQNQFPQFNIFLSFESPFWRVKVGEFRSRSDAENAMAEIKEVFPAYAPYLRVVRN